MRVFMSVLNNSRSIRFSYNLYRASPEVLQAALIVLYGLKCYLSLAGQNDDKPQLVYFASYPNEHRVLRHVRGHLSAISQGEITVSLANCFRLASARSLSGFIPATARLYRFARKLVRRFDFMPACRIFSTATYYLRFQRLLQAETKAVFIACHYSPECLGLAAAAHRAGKKVLFTNHASATGDAHYVPPLHADLVAATSEAVADLYRRHTGHPLDIVPITIVEAQHSMQFPDNGGATCTVGIYLTALTNEDRLNEIVSEWRALLPDSCIFVRVHPARVVNADLSDLAASDKRLEISGAQPLREDIARTDIAICGNSTVTIELLRGGRPVLYDDRLDRLAYDYNGYLDRGLVTPYPEPVDDRLFARVRAHYGNDEWRDTMRYFDSGYCADEQRIMQEFAAAVERTIGGSNA
jgi:hypothetical protein